WCPEVRMVAQCCRACPRETRPLGRPQGQWRCEGLLGLQAAGVPGCPQRQALGCGVAHARDEDAPVPSTAAATATPPRGAGLAQGVDVAVALRGPALALLREVLDERARCVCAFSRGGASVTPWLPCARGKVAMTRGAGLT